ncbi:hypothetical protein KKI90_07255 [Xenorhabdus bovienii]|uniref:hypothetical protein n=1 Tax=Xenorhabdus bovienii TaxID=40576 RepID=UPI00237CCBB5|nr:hypothetical protein [Xenorhabdus bovienii]MDE1486072.1 hypothetical protein [Xenorhabdus bovienii]MDE9478809.1 hypothetical protein [Xenorhabdus bovienii]MDE9531729.1 hypothetical protein [Xenorhabdus bovienii]
MATLVDTLLVALKLDMSGFANDANKAIKALDDLSKKSDGASTAVVKLSDGVDEAADSTNDLNQSNQELTKSTETVGKSAKNTSSMVLSFSDRVGDASDGVQDLNKSINGAIKALTGLFTTIFVSSGLAKLVSDVSRSNDQLYFLSKNLGMNAETIKKWQNVAEMSGGSADGMAATMTNLNKSLWDLVTMGDASILPFFNALGIGVVDSYGKIRNLDDILLDMADSFSKMSRPQAYNIAKNMGLDEGTINTLLEGRDAIQKRLDAQKNVVISTKEELELNRQLREQNSVLGQQWEGLKTLIANYLTPYLLKFSERVSGFLSYLNQNRETAISVFKGIATIIGVALIPMIIACGSAFLAMFAPLFTGVGLIALLSLGLLGLYDDYQTWKKGGDSLFDWTEWSESIEYVLKKLNEFKKWFKNTTIGQWFKNTDGEISNLKLAFGAFATYIATKWVGKILGAFGKISRGAKNIKVPGGKLGVVGKAGAVGLAAGAAYGSEEYIDSSLNSAFGEYDWFQRVRTAQNWSDFGSALVGLGDAKWVNGQWVDNRGKGLGSSITEATLDIPTGDPEIDKLKAKVRRGEMTLDELNSVILGGKPKTLPIVQTPPLKGNTRGERNNNPLNMEFAEQKGATVENHPEQRFAKFGTAYEGLERTAWQLRRYFNGLTDKVQRQSVDLIVSKWAPPGKKDNNRTEEYIQRVAKRLGVGRHDRLDLNDDNVMYALMNAMSQDEIGKPLPYSKNLIMAAIKGQGDPMVNLANNISAFSETISKPLVPNMDVNASSQFLAQTDKIKAQPTINSTNVKVDLNGDINVTTTADTVKGTVSDAGQAARESLSQIIPSMG